MFVSSLNAQELLTERSVADQKSYIEKYKQLAIDEMICTGIPASITLAQGILECRAGTSGFVLRGCNNHFGIKCHGWVEQGNYYRYRESDGACFRCYDKDEDSYRDHSRFLMKYKRYDFLWTYGRNYKAWARGLQKAGYAGRSKTYAAKLIKIIERHELYKLDGKTEQIPTVSIRIPHTAESAPNYSVQPDTLPEVRRRIAIARSDAKIEALIARMREKEEEIERLEKEFEDIANERN